MTTRTGRLNSRVNSLIRFTFKAEFGRWSPVNRRRLMRIRWRIGRSPSTKSSIPSLGCAFGATRQTPRHSEFMIATTGPRHQLLNKNTCATARQGRPSRRHSMTSTGTCRAFELLIRSMPPEGSPSAFQRSPPVSPILGPVSYTHLTLPTKA